MAQKTVLQFLLQFEVPWQTKTSNQAQKMLGTGRTSSRFTRQVNKKLIFSFTLISPAILIVTWKVKPTTWHLFPSHEPSCKLALPLFFTWLYKYCHPSRRQERCSICRTVAHPTTLSHVMLFNPEVNEKDRLPRCIKRVCFFRPLESRGARNEHLVTSAVQHER